MQRLDGARVVLGVTGGIAAYKSVELCRRLCDAGAFVSPIMTRAATRFIGETTLSALASEPVRTTMTTGDDPIAHTTLGQQADVIVVCPATARLLSDYRTGRSADLLTATLIATEAPVVLAPAMHTEMWQHPAVKDNAAVLIERGVNMVGPATGRLAGGDVGAGRLAAIDDIVEGVISALSAQDLKGQRILITAGGTREPLDPVRYLGNRSSGRQGVALAREAASRGAIVTLVATMPVAMQPPHNVIEVETAAEMANSVEKYRAESDVFIMAAAVADFRVVTQSDTKIKKRDGVPEVTLEPTADILAALGANKRPDQMIVGFAAETSDLRSNAAEKLVSKGADLIVANDVSAPEVGFGHETNAVLILGPDDFVTEVPLTQKRAVAAAVLDEVARRRK
jgi:phosphopantothenoylcysteine decarboxylase/phosphopantothenate--cysteine ligase